MKSHVACVLAGLACFGAFGIELTSADYVSSGLIGHWDGLENAGRGLYDASTNYWVDLSGETGDFHVQTAVAGFTANGLQKTARGFAASNTVVRFDVCTIEVVASGIPASGWVNAIMLRRGQTVTFNDGNVSGKRSFFFDSSNYGWTTDSRPAQITVCTFYDQLEANPFAKATDFLQNGVKPAGYVQSNYWSDADPLGMYIGGRAGWSTSGDANTTGYTIHAIRLYNRKLSPAEANYNAALDRIRFFGASADDLPYTFQDGKPKYRISAVAGVGGCVMQGFVTDDMVGDARVDKAWLTLSDSETYVFRAAPLPGWRFAGWECDVPEVVTSSAEPTVLMVTPAHSMEVRAHFEPLEASATYVTNGLVCRLDGLENAGTGLHVAATNVWKDLAETAGDFHVLPTVAKFENSALYKNAQGVMATNAVRRADALTMEGLVSDVPGSGWVNAFFVDENQTLTFNNSVNDSGQRAYFVDDNRMGWITDERPASTTLAVTYERESDKMRGSALYVNGAVPASGTAYKNWWGVNNAVGMSIGARSGSNNSSAADIKVVGYSVHGIRLYNRGLTAGEAAYNAALDQVRFFHVSTNAMPYRLTAEGNVECVLRAWTGGMGGQVVVGTGTPAQCIERDWRAFGVADEATFTAVPEDGWKFLGWRGNVEAITSGTTNSATVVVSTTHGAALEAVFTSTDKYVRNGLIGFWDAIENAGYGRHEVMPRVWTDLTGQTGDFMMNPYAGEFAADALTRTRVARSARRASRSGIRTIEVVVSGLRHGNQWTVPVLVSVNQHLTFRDTSATGVRQFFFDYEKTGFVTTEMPTNMTLTVTFRSDDESDRCFMNGVEATGTPYSNYWTEVDGGPMVIGARTDYSSEAWTRDYRIHAIRFYDRELTEAEIERNARADAVRFFGAPEKLGTVLIFR